MDKNSVFNIRSNMDTYNVLIEGEAADPARLAFAYEAYICEELDAMLREGATYTGPGGMNGEWEYIGKGEGSYYNFALLEGPDALELHKVSVDWDELAGCIEELQRTYNGLVAETGCSIWAPRAQL